MPQITGTYKLEKHDNYEAYLVKLGVSYVVRKMLNNLSCTLDIRHTDDDWIIKIKSTFRTTENKFKLGEEYEEKYQNGVVTKNVSRLDGDKLITLKKHDVIGECSSELLFTELGLIETLYHAKSQTTATRYFKKV